MALSLRFLGQASRQASQIATPIALTPRALASGATSGAASPRTPRSPRMSIASAGEQVPCFGSCVDLDAHASPRQGSFVGGMDNIKTPSGSILGESINLPYLAYCKTLPGFGGQELDVYTSFLEDEHSPCLGNEAAEDTSTQAGSSRAGHDSPHFGDVEEIAHLTSGDLQMPMLLGHRRSFKNAHELASQNQLISHVEAHTGAAKASSAAPEVPPHLLAAQAARDTFIARQPRRSGRRLA